MPGTASSRSLCPRGGRPWSAPGAAAAARGARVALAGGAAVGDELVAERRGRRAAMVELEAPWPVAELLAASTGSPPLPPYIARHARPKPDDAERYQTVYAREGASVAAPTAGLHFTPELLGPAAPRAGCEVHDLRLDVGPGTFRPIVAAAPSSSTRWTPEPAVDPAGTAEAIARAQAEGRRVVAVGTTTTRALESAAVGRRRARGTGAAGLFIRPPHRFRVVDALLTNFHLPRSRCSCSSAPSRDASSSSTRTRTRWPPGYRFYSFGDAMLLT